ncbi:MAG: TonB-dependent receptor, partial [Opitutaceae bacterium]|nr:TonB-dependent receptor [Opitutaceae bacterium]
RTLAGTVVTSGLELSGRYSLDQLLPGWARGLQVKFSASRATITGGGPAASAFAAQNLYLFPWSVGGGVTFSRKYYSISLNGKWNDEQRRTYYTVESDTTGRYEPGTYDYVGASFRLDLDVTFRLTKKFSLFLNGRDINGYTQEYFRYGPNCPEILQGREQSKFASVWTLGVKGNF